MGCMCVLHGKGVIICIFGSHLGRVHIWCSPIQRRQSLTLLLAASYILIVQIYKEAVPSQGIAVLITFITDGFYMCLEWIPAVHYVTHFSSQERRQVQDPSAYKPNLKLIEMSCRKIWPV